MNSDSPLPEEANLPNRTISRVLSLFRSRAFLGALLLVVAISLILAHGFTATRFLVDQVTLGLLALAALPFISTLVTSVKAGGVELAFRDMSVHDQVVLFLDGIATKRQWTFFSPRSGESNLGPAFVVLSEELLRSSRGRLVVQLRQWLASDDANQRWFAAEIIGYHQLRELRRSVQRAPETADLDATWEPWELNCVWAYSRLEERPYERLKAFLFKTRNESNQMWILQSFDQMIEAEFATAEQFAATVALFVEQSGDELIKPLRHLQACQASAAPVNLETDPTRPDLPIFTKEKLPIRADTL